MNILIVAFAQNFRANSKNIEIENKVANFIKDKSNNSVCFFLAETHYGEEPEKGLMLGNHGVDWQHIFKILNSFFLKVLSGIAPII